jgi:hypothetical protein
LIASFSLDFPPPFSSKKSVSQSTDSLPMSNQRALPKAAFFPLTLFILRKPFAAFLLHELMPLPQQSVSSIFPDVLFLIFYSSLAFAFLIPSFLHIQVLPIFFIRLAPAIFNFPELMLVAQQPTYLF